MKYSFVAVAICDCILGGLRLTTVVTTCDLVQVTLEGDDINFEVAVFSLKLSPISKVSVDFNVKSF